MRLCRKCLCEQGFRPCYEQVKWRRAACALNNKKNIVLTVGLIAENIAESIAFTYIGETYGQKSKSVDSCSIGPNYIAPIPTGSDPQCCDTVGWVIWPVKPIPDMTYNVFGGMLNTAQPSTWRDRDFANPESRDWKINSSIAIPACNQCKTRRSYKVKQKASCHSRDTTWQACVWQWHVSFSI